MRTTEQWWEEVSNSPEKMIDWLKKQYHGEVTAEKRIRDMITKYDLQSSLAIDIISTIADQEQAHAEWVKALLMIRGITPEILDKEERYWNETLPAAEGKSFQYMCAVAHLAETMRLERITLLASDERFEDIARIFKLILKDELFHASAFGKLSTPEDIAEAKIYHTNGMNALGLIA